MGVRRQAAARLDRFGRQAADHNDLHVGKGLVAFQGSQHFNAIDAWHRQVGNQQVWPHAGDVHQRLDGGRHPGAINRQVPLLKLAAVQFPLILVVLYHQHPQAAFRVDVGACKLRAVSCKVFIDGGKRDSAVAAQRLPGVDLSFFNQRLNRRNRQPHQFCGVAGAAVVFAGEICSHDGSLKRLGLSGHGDPPTL